MDTIAMKPHSLGFTFPSNYLKSTNVNCTGIPIKYQSINYYFSKRSTIATLVSCF